ncbi:hypothetical protein [Pseudonocardia sp. ICBG601]|uniref:hypothetical protein n=1 Tax=Pseudonocardia sp. ICBG601 TaxID=2846759 RepID=UPI001CF68058|nr:hypothetical protein [Pseudonocardia sp. ICBG601]
MARKKQEPIEPPTAGSSFAEKLRYLQAKTIQPDGSAWSAQAAVNAITATGAAMSPAYFSEMRSGATANPSAKVIQSLADLFGVSPAFFFNDAAAVEQETAQIELEVALREAHIEHVAAKASQLSPAQQAAFNRALTQVVLGGDTASRPAAAPE